MDLEVWEGFFLKKKLGLKKGGRGPWGPYRNFFFSKLMITNDI